MARDNDDFEARRAERQVRRASRNKSPRAAAARPPRGAEAQPASPTARSASSRRGLDAQAVASTLATVAAGIGRALAFLLRTLWRALKAVLRHAVPFCRRYPKQVLAALGVALIAAIVSQVRGQIAAERLSAYNASIDSGAQYQAQQLVSTAKAAAEELVEPSSTPREEWARGSMPYLYQIDPQWSQEAYSNDTLRIQGCGPTALSMVYIDLTGDTSMDPPAMCAFATKYGYSTDRNGTSWSLMTEGAAILGITGTQVSPTESRLRSELEAGRPVICIMNPGHFTTVGHFIVLEKLDDDGKVVVHDSNSLVRSSKTWDLGTICSEAAAAWSFTA